MDALRDARILDGLIGRFYLLFTTNIVGPLPLITGGQQNIVACMPRAIRMRNCHACPPMS